MPRPTGDHGIGLLCCAELNLNALLLIGRGTPEPATPLCVLPGLTSQLLAPTFLSVTAPRDSFPELPRAVFKIARRPRRLIKRAVRVSHNFVRIFDARWTACGSAKPRHGDRSLMAVDVSRVACAVLAGHEFASVWMCEIVVPSWQARLSLQKYGSRSSIRALQQEIRQVKVGPWAALTECQTARSTPRLHPPTHRCFLGRLLRRSLLLSQTLRNARCAWSKLARGRR
jgi:hypothetical protein